MLDDVSFRFIRQTVLKRAWLQRLFERPIQPAGAVAKMTFLSCQTAWLDAAKYSKAGRPRNKKSVNNFSQAKL